MSRIHTSEPFYRPTENQWAKERARGSLHPMWQPEPAWRSALAVSIFALSFAALLLLPQIVGLFR